MKDFSQKIPLIEDETKREQIRRLREIIGLQKQKDFAALIGEKPTTLSTIVSGEGELSIRIAKKFADFANCSLDYLYGRSDIKNPYEPQNIETEVPLNNNDWKEKYFQCVEEKDKLQSKLLKIVLNEG